MTLREVQIVGFASIVVCFVTWTMDLNGTVGPCGFCRVQRTVIGLLGLLLALSPSASMPVRFLGNVLAFLGGSVAAQQHFNGWNDVSKGVFKFAMPGYDNGFILSACALAIIVAQAMILNRREK